MALLIKITPVPNEMVVFIRFILGLAILSPWIFSGKIQIVLKAFPKHLIRALAGLIAVYCYFYALEMLPIINAVSLSNTTPLFMPIVIFFWLKRIVPKWRLVGVAIGFIGVLFVLQPTLFMFEWATLAGLGSGILGALALLGVRQLSRVESTETILAYYFLISSCIAFFPALYAWRAITAMEWLSVLSIGVFSTIAQFFLTKSFTHSPASKASALTYLNVVFSGIAAWFLLNESPNWIEVTGIFLVVVGGLITILDQEQSTHWGKKSG